jgi:hypothetical protein
MARNTEASQQIIISAATIRRNTPKKTLLIYVNGKEPNTNLRNNQSKALKFNNNLIKQHKHNTSLSLRCSRKNRMTGNKLYEANHLCMMKIALIKEKTTRKPPPQDIIHP